MGVGIAKTMCIEPPNLFSTATTLLEDDAMRISLPLSFFRRRFTPLSLFSKHILHYLIGEMRLHRSSLFANWVARTTFVAQRGREKG